MSNFCELRLTRGQYALVDARDYKTLKWLRWAAWKNPRTGQYYAIHGFGGETVWLARDLLGLNLHDPRRADHINGDTLDNRRANLRIVNLCQNAQNSKLPITNKSGYKGVSLRKSTGRYEARITAYGEKYHLGFFDTIEEAIIARKDAEERLHGEYARVS